MKLTACNPFSKVEEIMSIIKAYNPEIGRSEDAFMEIRITSPFSEELWIEISTEFTIFFGDWHAHYGAYEEYFRMFLDDLMGILQSKRCTVCGYRDGKWCGSDLSDKGVPDLSEILEEFGEDKQVVCSFWDKSKNVTYEPLG
ncbi:MAG: hypothetical protein K2I93_06005 [Oscillospiraceae bacterium]|nr:hypothetical protein [Oscillospiraceae bacterium]